MNKRAHFEDLLELLFGIIVLVVAVLLSLFFRASHSDAIAGAAAAYSNEVDTLYSLNNILRTHINLEGHNASVAEFIILSVEEKSSFFGELFGNPLRKKLSDKFKELAVSAHLSADVSMVYKGKSYVLYSSGLASSGEDYSSFNVFPDTIQLPSFDGGFVELKVVRYVVY